MVDVRLKKPEYVVGKKVSISIMLLLGPGAIEVLTTLVMFASVGRVRPNPSTRSVRKLERTLVLPAYLQTGQIPEVEVEIRSNTTIIGLSTNVRIATSSWIGSDLLLRSMLYLFRKVARGFYKRQ